MLMPSIFRDTFFDSFMNDFGFQRAGGNGTKVSGVMKSDAKETENGYEIAIDMPGYKKDDVKAQLKDGYLTISAKTENSDEKKDEKGNYIWKERYTGAVSRSFYVGRDVTEEDVHAKFEDGILKLQIPKETKKPIEENKFISIEG